MTWSSTTGWPSKIRLVNAVLLAAVFLVPIATAAPRDEEATPDMDFLEFLGSWQTRDGQWVDPLQVGDLPPGELETDRTATDRGKKPAGFGKERRSSDSTNDPPPSDDDVRPRRRDR